MNNKVIVKVVVPVLEQSYDVFIPINKKVGNVIQNISKLISDLSGGYFEVSNYNQIYDGDTGLAYPIDVLVYNTNIRNGSKLILM